MARTDISPESEVIDARAEALLDRAARDVGADGLPSCALTVLRGAEVLLDAVIGAPHDATHLLWSASKGLASGVFAGLVSDGVVQVEQRVVDHLPWFTGDGRDEVTVEHLLLHTAGMPAAPMLTVEGGDPVRRRARMATWQPRTAPGAVTDYHHTSAHWLLASVVEAVTGATFAEAWRVRVAEPLGLAATTFAPDPDDPRRQRLARVGEPTPADVVRNLAEQGIDLDAMVAEASVDNLLTFEEPDVLRAGSPGAGAVGPARELARFYAALLSGAPNVWTDDVRIDFTTNVRNRLAEPGLGMAANRTLGFVISGDDGAAGMRQLPTSLGPRVFGHAGVGGQIAWADPATGLVFAHLTNGLHQDPLVWWARVGELNELAAALA